MARVVFAIGLLGSFAAAFKNPISKEEINRRVASLSVRDALRRLGKKLPANIVALAEEVQDHGKTRQVKFLQTSTKGLSSNDKMDKGSVDEARIKINDMVEEVQEGYDKEWVRCTSTSNEEEAVLNETALDIALYRAQLSTAQADHLRAEGSINTLENTQERLNDEKDKSWNICLEQIAQMEQEIAIMVNDSIIMEKILGMINCDTKKAASFIQCEGMNTTFHQPEVRTEMLKLKSDKVKAMMHSAAQQGFDFGEGEKKISRASFLQESSVGFQQPNMDKSPNPFANRAGGPGPDEKPCSLRTNPNCGKLEDKFEEIAGEIDSDITVYNIHLEKRRGECNDDKANYESQIDDIRSRLEAWQTALAESTTRTIQAREGEELKQGQYTKLSDEHHETVDECAENLGNFESEMCSLERIRGELFKMSAIKKFIVDCEVSKWQKMGCSKDCRESDSDKPGRENLTREEIKEAELGAECPPLRLEQVCGTTRCPINCAQSSWSEWSACSVECGGGIRERIRSVKQVARFEGDPCGPASETETCNAQNCDKDCILDYWTKIQDVPCSKACGGGSKIATRGIFQNAIGQGTCPDPKSPARERQVGCNMMACDPVGATLVCESKVDVVILLDGSGSLGQSGWKATVAMGQTLVKAFANPGVQVAVQLFSGPQWKDYWKCVRKARKGAKKVSSANAAFCGIKWVTALGDNGHFTTDMDAAATAIAALTFPAKGTFTSLGLAQAEAELTYSREDAQKVVVTITDGWPQNRYQTGLASNSVKRIARSIWVPVGRNAPLAFLNSWATYPAKDNVVIVKDFKQLQDNKVVTDIVAEVCEKAK